MDINERIKALEKKGYKEVGSQINETWDFNKNDTFEGVFVEKREGIGQNNSNLYVFEGKDNTQYGVWGSSILDARLSNLSVGEEVVIFYLGLETSEKTGREYKNYKVFKPDTLTQETVDKDEVPFPEDE